MFKWNETNSLIVAFVVAAIAVFVIIVASKKNK